MKPSPSARWRLDIAPAAAATGDVNDAVEGAATRAVPNLPTPMTGNSKLAWRVVNGRIVEAQPEQAMELSSRLQAFNAAAIGPVQARRIQLALLGPSDEPELRGGLIGDVMCGWLAVLLLWVDPAERGQGGGTALLSAAEVRSRALGCHAAFVDTFDWQARGFYEHNGYGLCGQLDDFPMGHTRYLLRKDFFPRPAHAAPLADRLHGPHPSTPGDEP